MKLEKDKVDDLIELRNYLIEDEFPQSFKDLLEECFINGILIIKK